MFPYPFNYVPSPLARQVAEDLKRHLATHPEWRDEIRRGKMFGVLVAEDRNGEKRTLFAFSGTLGGQNVQPGFVPPVFDLVKSDYFQKEEAEISAMDAGKERKERSINLQNWLFQQFIFLNAKGESKGLPDIFADAGRTPPSGTGECCAPRLLQEAYRNGWTPLDMAEFWMGDSPQDELREEGRFYPACRSRCKPILEFMLQGLEVAENPLLKRNRAMADKLKILFETPDFVIVDKPGGMLSVPGKDDLPSVLSEMKKRYPNATGPMICHRLDMDTSGLMVVALNEAAYKELQRKFIAHEVRKTYVALLEKPMPVGEKGRVKLPMCPNPYDRPRQIVSEEYGKKSDTIYEVVGEKNGHAVVKFQPLTGRTHQLRVHAAYVNGLHNPIVGDNLYGTPGERLCLHAAELEFTFRDEKMQFESTPDFEA